MDRSLGHRAPLLWLALPFMAGLAAGAAGPAIAPAGLLAAAFAAAAAAVWAATARSPRRWTAALAASMALAGDASYGLHRRRSETWEGRPPREAKLSLRIDRVYLQSDPRKAAGLATVTQADGHLRELTGQRIYYSISLRRGQEEPERSAVVSAKGLLVLLPRAPPSDTFDGALAGLGLNFRLTRARIVAQESPASAYHRACGRLARRMNALLGAGLDRRPELAAMYRAMMLGRKNDLSPRQKQLFMHSGAMHLFAINGLHIGMVTVALHALLALLRCPRSAASVLVLAVLWLDVDATGASPSAIRAFLMVAVLEAAYVLRRPGNPIAALASSALAILLLDPMDFFSASFRMSYAVVAAILTLGLPLASRLKTRFPAYRDLPEITWSLLQRGRAWAQRHFLEAAGIGIAAALVGAVTGIEFFGLFTPGGIAANLALVPLAALVIVSGCLSLIFGFAGATPAGVLFNHAAAVLLAAIVGLMQAGSRVPGACLAARYRADWIGPAALAALMAALLTGYASGWRRNRGGWWPPFAIVGLTLIFGVKFG